MRRAALTGVPATGRRVTGLVGAGRRETGRRVAGLGVTLLLVAGCSGEPDPFVRTAEVGRATVAEQVEAPGTVAARATAALTAPAEGAVAEVLVEDGAQVAAGTVLVRLSSPAAVDRLEQARAALAQAEDAAVPVPRPDVRPLQGALDAAAAASFAAGRSAAALVTDPAARARAEQQVRDAEREYASSRAAAQATLAQAEASAEGLEQALAAVTAGQRASARAAVGAAEATVAALTVRAPLAGVVTLGAGQAAGGSADELAGLVSSLPAQVQGQAEQALGQRAGGATTTVSGLSVGAPVETGQPLLTVTDLSALTVTAEVDETDVLLVAAGTPARVEVDAVPGAQYPATVTAVDLAPTTSSQGGVSYAVRLALRGGTTGDEAPAPPPRPGMSAVVDLQVRTAEDALAVPSAAVVRDGRADAVFVVEAGRVVRREIRVGAQGDELVQVLAGLEPGARVVVRDADRLQDGQAVRT